VVDNFKTKDMKFLIKKNKISKFSFGSSLAKAFRSIYYSFLFGERKIYANFFRNVIDIIEKKYKLADSPVGEDVWEAQYINGRWKKLNNLHEVAHYSAIIGYIQYLKPKSSILDVGCGEGILFRRFKPNGYFRYIGIDISQTAINTLAQDQDENSRFIVTDAETYVSQELFDVIIFNEVLYYFLNPLKTVIRYADLLKDSGIIIVSTYTRSDRAKAILRQIKTKLSLLDEVKITHSPRSWIVSVFIHSKMA